MEISKLAPSQRKKGRWLVHLEDGTILRMDEAVVTDFALYTGKDLDQETLAKVTAAAQKSQLKEKALNMLSVRPLSRKELEKKLLDKEGDPGQISQLSDWLESVGLLNDQAYASTVVNLYSRKGYGSYKVKAELYRRGVPKEFWEEALAEQEDSTQAIDSFLEKKLRDCHGDPKLVKRATDALARRGYRWSEISEAMERYKAQQDFE